MEHASSFCPIRTNEFWDDGWTEDVRCSNRPAVLYQYMCIVMKSTTFSIALLGLHCCNVLPRCLFLFLLWKRSNQFVEMRVLSKTIVLGFFSSYQWWRLTELILLVGGRVKDLPECSLSPFVVLWIHSGVKVVTRSLEIRYRKPMRKSSTVVHEFLQPSSR